MGIQLYMVRSGQLFAKCLILYLMNTYQSYIECDGSNSEEHRLYRILVIVEERPTKGEVTVYRLLIVSAMDLSILGYCL